MANDITFSKHKITIAPTKMMANWIVQTFKTREAKLKMTLLKHLYFPGYNTVVCEYHLSGLDKSQ